MMDVTLAIPLLFGLAGGWIVNYLSDVLPVTRRFSKPACPACGADFAPARYVLWQSCAGCGAGRSARTILTPLMMIAASVYVWMVPPRHIEIWMALLLLIYFGVVFVIDLEHRAILQEMSIAGAVIGLALGWYAYGVIPSLIGGAAGFGIMLAFYYFGEFFRRSMSKRRGEEVDTALGFGDVNLAGVIGLIVGWPLIFIGLIFAIFAGGVVSLLIVAKMLITRRFEAFVAMAYGPYLILGAALILFFPWLIKGA